ncbi:hypothetical protein HID58_025434 [Brassica napus]|uniref:Uricase n=1 Tax=Brassica napus TaxID=3708 RepID=A0ABQ8CL34_BRANA|nr:uricase isoform X2 [Brassica napus]KAH0917774.1 hypothetical protein HID58_025434 [Brassica napus]
MAAGGGLRVEQRHGKARVRVGRVWRQGADGSHHFVEWNVSISLLSHCLSSYHRDDNSDIVATDTMKNTVYVKAKECGDRLSVEEFAILLGNHFCSFYPQVYTAIVNIIEKPWERVCIDGKPHLHGFKLGSENHTVEATVQKSGALTLTSGVAGLALLKTTQSGFEKFVRDKYTILPDTRERMLATEVNASWRYSYESVASIPKKELYFSEKFMEVKKVLMDTFFGPPETGVYSPSVQRTLYLMGSAVLRRFPDVASIHLKMPNIHFLPVNLSTKENPSMVKFKDDVYLPTDEPHGSIEATLSRITSKM